jgi:hypothetical protein
MLMLNVSALLLCLFLVAYVALIDQPKLQFLNIGYCWAMPTLLMGLKLDQIKLWFFRAWD